MPVKIEQYSQFEVKHYQYPQATTNINEDKPHSGVEAKLSGFNSGYSKQKQEDFQNIIDRTQSIDTLATGMDRNMSPRRRMVSTNADTVQDSSAIFTLYTRDKSIDKNNAYISPNIISR